MDCATAVAACCCPLPQESVLPPVPPPPPMAASNACCCGLGVAGWAGCGAVCGATVDGVAPDSAGVEAPEATGLVTGASGAARPGFCFGGGATSGARCGCMVCVSLPPEKVGRYLTARNPIPPMVATAMTVAAAILPDFRCAPSLFLSGTIDPRTFLPPPSPVGVLLSAMNQFPSCTIFTTLPESPLPAISRIFGGTPSTM